MKTTIFTLIILAIFFFWPKIKVVDATSQDWAGGRYESGYGTDYKITLVAKRNSDVLVIDQLWVGDKYFEVEAVKNPAKRSDHVFSKRDTVYLMTGLKYKPDEQGNYIMVNEKTRQIPGKFDSQALIGYTFKGKRKYIEIDSLRILEKIIYP